jgi:hypothetical protein
MNPSIFFRWRHAAVATVVAILPTMSFAAVPGPDVIALLKDPQRGRGIAVAPDDLLDRPGYPYSDLEEQPDFTNATAWTSVLGSLPSGIGHDDALDILRWDLGATRARPGVDVATRGDLSDPFIEASVVKAGVDADIFRHMIDLTGYEHSTRAAGFAVAMQILRRQIEQTPAERRDALGVRADVFDRMMAARFMDHLTSYDVNYLSLLLQYHLVHRRYGDADRMGARELPAAYRVARVAAAYRDLEGYLLTYPCNRDATPREGRAGTGRPGDDRPLCFAGATDRAVYQWYLGEVDRQAHRIPDAPHESGLAKVLAAAALFMPLLDAAAIVEFAGAAEAESLAAEAFAAEESVEATAERALPLSCARVD